MNVYGIDFGTTNTIITKFNQNKSSADLVLDGSFKHIPSKIGFIDNKIYCGNYIPSNCQNIIHSFKITCNENQKEYYKIFFTHLKNIINEPNPNVVITVPSNFNDTQRMLISTTFENVGFNVIRLINEPSAAALAYGLDKLEDIKFLVIDTGGGTTDLTLLEHIDGLFEVITSIGVNDLGGNDFTNIILDNMINYFRLDEEHKNILFPKAQLMKEKLSWLDNYQTNFTINEKTYTYSLTKTSFEILCKPLIKKFEDTLSQIKNKYSNIEKIIMVGGTSRIPLIANTIFKIFEMKPLIHKDLDFIVAKGAGLYGGMIKGLYKENKNIVFMDVLPQSLGVELVDGSFSIIIPKNTPLPVKLTQKFTTNNPSDPSIKIKVYQGERQIANLNHFIGEFIFNKITLGGTPIIDISFNVDLNSIITINVLDRKTGNDTNIIFKKQIVDINENYEIYKEQDYKILQKMKLIYQIETFISNALENLSAIEFETEQEKIDMINEFDKIEKNIETEPDNIILIDILSGLEKKYNLFGQNNSDNKLEDNNNNDKSLLELNNMEQVDLLIGKKELEFKIQLLLANNPDFEEYLLPVIETMNSTKVDLDWIKDKLNLLKQLETELEPKEEKNQLKQLCAYLLNGLHNGTIDIGDYNKELEILVNDYMNRSEENNINELCEELNNKCLELYSKINPMDKP